MDDQDRASASDRTTYLRDREVGALRRVLARLDEDLRRTRTLISNDRADEIATIGVLCERRLAELGERVPRPQLPALA